MKKVYRFGAHVTVSAFTDVVASSLAEAEEIARSRDEIGHYHIGCGNDSREMWLVEDIDGSPEGITFEGEGEGEEEFEDEDE